MNSDTILTTEEEIEMPTELTEDLKLRTRSHASTSPSAGSKHVNDSYNKSIDKKEVTNVRIEKRQAERKLRLRDVCSTLPASVRSHRSRWAYKLNIRDKYLYCPIPKSGWSSWKRLWFYTSGVIDSYDTDVGIQSDKAADVVDVQFSAIKGHLSKQKYNYSFAFVRNPWQRLVSAYINKAVDYNYTRILHTPCKWERMEPYKPNLTFQQFLQCITNSKSNDMHWVPQWTLCNFCSANFDFIGHMETVAEDANYVISKIGLNVDYPHSFPSKAYKTDSVLADWYADLPVELLQALYNKFKYDFEMHGFNPQPPNRTDVLTV